MISISFFHVFIVNNLGKCLRGGVSARFYRLEGSGFCQGGGGAGGMVRLGID